MKIDVNQANKPSAFKKQALKQKREKLPPINRPRKQSVFLEDLEYSLPEGNEGLPK